MGFLKQLLCITSNETSMHSNPKENDKKSKKVKLRLVTSTRRGGFRSFHGGFSGFSGGGDFGGGGGCGGGGGGGGAGC
ncbi:hypothetical protein DFH28DRAFT_1127660 [Melampsora americana]|nr:hypothetical protein DFH28DRAFT_1127660 [Melampsora americana]